MQLARGDTMLSAINNFIVNCSASWWKTLLLLAGQSAAFRGMNAITTRFPEITAGDIPFDMQNDLRPEQVFTQLAGYTEQAFSDYYLFQAIDFAFPLLAGLFLACLFTFGLRHAAPRFYAYATARNLLVLMLLPVMFDYLENINLLWAVTAWPERADLAAQLGVLAKQAKLATLYTAFALTGLALLGAAVRWVGRRVGLFAN